MSSPFTIIGVGSPIVDAIAQVQDNFIEQIDGDKGGMVLVDAPTIEMLLSSLPETQLKRLAALRVTLCSRSHAWRTTPVSSAK